MDYNKLSKDELICGLQKTLKNGNSHFETAELLSNINKFGIANSHLILSSEEYIKSIFYFMKIIRPKIELDINGIFRNHKGKNNVSFEMYFSF